MNALGNLQYSNSPPPPCTITIVAPGGLGAGRLPAGGVGVVDASALPTVPADARGAPVVAGGVAETLAGGLWRRTLHGAEVVKVFDVVSFPIIDIPIG